MQLLDTRSVHSWQDATEQLQQKTLALLKKFLATKLAEDSIPARKTSAVAKIRFLSLQSSGLDSTWAGAGVGFAAGFVAARACETIFPTIVRRWARWADAWWTLWARELPRCFQCLLGLERVSGS